MLAPVNMLFLEPSEIGIPLPRSDARVRHVIKVLGKGPGDEIIAGTPDGLTGTALIEAVDDKSMTFSFHTTGEAPDLYPVTLILGFPRPIQANRILKDLASLGVGRIILSGTELGEKSYFQSDFFRNREFRAALVEGAMQSSNPRLPVVDTAWTLARAIGALGTTGPRFAFDPYRSKTAFGSIGPIDAKPETPLVLAIGSERGWTPAELDVLEASGFSMTTLGARILKTETASLATVSIALAAMRLM